MSKTFWIVGGVIVLLILLGLGYLFYWPVSDAENTSDSTTGTKVSKHEYTLKEAVAVITERDFEIQSQNNLITELKGQIDEKDQQIANLIKTCTGKTKYLAAKNTGGNVGGNTKPANTNTAGLKSASVNGSSSNTEPEAEYLTQQNSVPKSKVKVEVNEIKFCIRLGNLFWPHLAVNQGEEFPEIVDNGIGGFDLYILPSGTIGSTGKDYGITEDYVYWIKKSRLTSWPETPYFLNKSGIFVKGQESGEYWIAK